MATTYVDPLPESDQQQILLLQLLIQSDHRVPGQQLIAPAESPAGVLLRLLLDNDEQTLVVERTANRVDQTN